MDIAEAQALDMSQIMLLAYDLGDMMKHSHEMFEYLKWKDKVRQNPEIQLVVQELNKEKERFEECERFGHYHPNYHEALNRVKEVESKLNEFEEVRQFKHWEDALDELLYEVSKTIAHSVSESVKVPSNKLVSDDGCGSGGSCKGNCG